MQIALKLFSIFLSNFIIVLLLGHNLFSVENKTATTRPRMLLSEHDPFTSLTTLKARYNAGMRPSEDIAGWALTYLLTGDESFARKSLEEMSRTHPPTKFRTRSYIDYIRWSLAYDWLYNYPGFSEKLKNRIAGELLYGAEKMVNDQELAYPRQTSYHNLGIRYVAFASFVLAAIEGHPNFEEKCNKLKEPVREAYENIMELAQFMTPRGGYHESMDYMRISYVPLAAMAELYRTTTGNDPARQITLFPNYSKTYLYKLLPDGSPSREGDNGVTTLSGDDNVALGYAINRFKDPYAAWFLRDSKWLPKNWSIPILEFLWNDPEVKPRNPQQSPELPEMYHFTGVGNLIMRDGWGPDSTWISFNAGPYLDKHQHMDQNNFCIYHKGHLAPESGADYWDTESPHYLNYYRRTIAHNSMLVFKQGEKFFWAENLWPAANDGGQRMDSSRFWHAVRNLEDWNNTCDLWNVAQMEAADYLRGAYQYARGNATRAYHPSKVELFKRELTYLPKENILIVFDRVRSSDPNYKKVWLLHAVNEPLLSTEPGSEKSVGHGGILYSNAKIFTLQDGNGKLRVHSLLPQDQELIKRGGKDWDFWTPADEFGGDWGSGKNWPMEPPEGGPLPEDPYLKKMWKTFWGENYNQLYKSPMEGVVMSAWRVEVSPAKPTKEDLFLHVMEISDIKNPKSPKIELIHGFNVTGTAIEEGVLSLYPTIDAHLSEAEATIPTDVNVHHLFVSGLKPESKYELQLTGGPAPGKEGGLYQGIMLWKVLANANSSGIIYVPFKTQKDGQLRIKLL